MRWCAGGGGGGGEWDVRLKPKLAEVEDDARELVRRLHVGQLRRLEQQLAQLMARKPGEQRLERGVSGDTIARGAGAGARSGGGRRDGRLRERGLHGGRG